MFDLVENWITSQLQRITLGGKALPVYPYIPDRDKGETQYPCTAFARQFWKVDFLKARDCEVFVPSTETVTRTFTPREAMGGPTERTGPVSWKVKPHPTPIIICYELRFMATIPEHRDRLALGIIQAFPAAQTPLIGEQNPLVMLGSPHNLDDQAKPLFETSIHLWVYEVWIQRLEEYAVKSITQIDLDSELATDLTRPGIDV